MKSPLSLNISTIDLLFLQKSRSWPVQFKVINPLIIVLVEVNVSVKPYFSQYKYDRFIVRTKMKK